MALSGSHTSRIMRLRSKKTINIALNVDLLYVLSLGLEKLGFGWEKGGWEKLAPPHQLMFHFRITLEDFITRNTFFLKSLYLLQRSPRCLLKLVIDLLSDQK